MRAVRCVVGAKPHGQRTERGLNADRRTPSAFALSYGGTGREALQAFGLVPG
jgi:hypothetical protein